MTITQKLALLGVYLGDVKEETYPSALKVLLLNQAQDRALDLLKRYVVTDLDKTATEQALDSSDGSLDVSTIGDDTPYKGIHGIYAIQLTDGKFSTKKSFSEYRAFVKRGNTFSTDHPIHYFIASTVYVNPYEDQTIDIFYRVEPTQMTVDVECGLNSCFHAIIVGLACENFIDVSPQAKLAYDRALSSIREFNDDTFPSETFREVSNQNWPHSNNSNANFLSR